MPTVWQVLELWYKTWTSSSPTHILTCSVGGMLGGCAYAAVINPGLVMPHYDRKAHKLYLGFAGMMFVGAVVGAVVDCAFPVALLGGLVATTVIELTNKVILPGLAQMALGWAADRTPREK